MPLAPNTDGQDPDEREQVLIDAARRQVHGMAADATLPLRAEHMETATSGTSGVPLSDSFAGYEITREIHRGGQGIVYQAFQESTKRKVAIKVMKEGPFAGSAEKARFEREVQVLGQLKHANIVAIHDSGEAAGQSYFVMDYISGQPLDVYMAGGEHSIDDSLKLFGKICDAVNAAHLKGVIHRDLKPGNIRIDDSGEPYILDFGLAKVATSEQKASLMTMTGQFVGSLPWSSPEQAEGKPGKIDVRTDVYSLGVILYQMLTGKFPYEVIGNMRDVLDRIMKAEPARPSTIRVAAGPRAGRINDEIDTIVLKSLSKERERRYQTAGELARDVRHYLAGEPIEAKRDSAWYVLRKAVAHRKRQVVSIGAVLVVAVAGYAFWSHARAATEAARLDAEMARTERVALVIESEWEPNSKKVRALYEEFFEKLKAGRTTPQERRLFLSNAIRTDVRTRRMWALDYPVVITLAVDQNMDFRGHGIVARVTATISLDGHQIDKLDEWHFQPGSADTHYRHARTVDLPVVFSELDSAQRFELKTVADLTFCWTLRDAREIPLAEWEANVICRDRRVMTETVLLLRSLPDNYPVAITSSDAAAQVQDAFKICGLQIVRDDGCVSLQYRNTGPIHLAGRLGIIDPRNGAVLEDRSFHAVPGEINMTISWVAEWAVELLRSLRNGDVETLRFRLVPDREVALSVADLETYWGLPLDLTAPVAEPGARGNPCRATIWGLPASPCTSQPDKEIGESATPPAAQP